ncbi:rho guanine nucleotide exchange factor 40 isoform X2 [Carettochelys insculpta]|uniref:rho guanine nucleotide exchange factor 40 isoform X2 n=1 Tax=Carettochelys insculpta TaxID=44489 RepID=UPI003EBC70D2
MGAAPAGTKEGGSPSGTGPPITSTSGEGDIPPSRVEGAVPPGTGVSVPPTPGEGDVPPSCAEGGVPPGTGVSVPPTPGEGDVPPSCAEGGVPPGTGVPLPPTPGEGDVPPSCTEGGVPPGTGVPLPPTPGEGDVPPSCAEGGVLPGTGVPGPPAPGEGNIPPSCAEGGSPSGTRLPGPPSPKEAAAAGCSGQVALPVARAEAAGSPGSLERMEAVGAGSTPFVRSAEPPREGAGAGCPLEALPPTPGPHGLDVDWELLRSGIFQLTGGVDRTGRALLTVNPQLMGKPAPGQEELSQALWYLHSLLRKEQRELGLTVLLDLRQRGTQPPFPPALPAALQELQEASPAPVSRLLVLGPPEGPAELPLAQALERLCVLCHGVIRSVQGTRVELEASGPAESEAVLTLHIAGHQEAMQKLLSDPRLLELQSSGGALLARLPPSGAHSAQAARAAALYQEVDDAIHRLVQFSNQRLEQLQQERSHRQLEQAQAGAQERVGCLSATEDSAEPEAGLGAQDQCCQQHSESSNSTLQETPGLVAQSSRALWDLGWYQARCQELGRFLQRRLEVALRAGPPPRRRADSTSASSSPQHPGRGRGLGTGLASSRSMSCVLPAPGSPSPGLCRAPLRLPVEHSDEEQSPSAAAFFQAPTLPLATSTPGRPPPKGPPSTQRALSIPVPSPPQPSVLIRGLEVSSQEVVDQTCSPREHVMVVRSGAQRAEAPWGGTPSTDRKRRLGAQQQLVAQLLALEQDYVGYLAESLPLEPGCQGLSPGLRRECQALESTRQQLLDFHRAYLLQGLQSCASHPLRVGACFLRYVEQFGLYAHYVKSQQKLAAALGCQSAASKTAHGSLEAPQEDVALGSALRRPLEQLERYGHFLGELLQETDPEQASERDALGEAQRMLDSQVQHGTNLLAMEQIRGCELDLAAQGQLLQRDELAVLQGRRKRHRHVFLFERLLLFCKRKGAGGGLDLYLCKQAFPTADMGLTENIGESGLCFELWFRHPKLRQAYTLQAPSPNVKHQWTSAVAQLLWSQATLSKVPKTMTGTGPAGAQGASSSGGAESPGGSAPGQRQPSWGWSLHRKLFASQNRTV